MSGRKKVDGRIFARFGCNDCGASFHAQHGNTEAEEEWRCPSCDHAELHPKCDRNGGPGPGCPKCGTLLEQGLDPKCPRCDSRDVLVLVPGMFFD